MYKKNFNRNFQPSFKKNTPRKNHFIFANEIQLITSSGENLGTKKKEEALKMAEEEGLDLIEINPNSKPPICKIMDYSKYMYDKKKKQKKGKTKVKEQKELRFSPVIEQHDIDVRVSRAKKFLAKGHNVKLTIFRKGRQTYEQAKEVMDKILVIFEEYNTIEAQPKQEGRKLYITIKAEKKKQIEKKEVVEKNEVKDNKKILEKIKKKKKS
jgi:translation initiation factor IF-3